MAVDLLFGKTKRNWGRDLQLTTNPSPAPAPLKPYQELVSDAKSFDRSLRVRPSGRGAVVTKVFKFG